MVNYHPSFLRDTINVKYIYPIFLIAMFSLPESLMDEIFLSNAESWSVLPELFSLNKSKAAYDFLSYVLKDFGFNAVSFLELVM